MSVVYQSTLSDTLLLKVIMTLGVSPKIVVPRAPLTCRHQVTLLSSSLHNQLQGPLHDPHVTRTNGTSPSISGQKVVVSSNIIQPFAFYVT